MLKLTILTRFEIIIKECHCNELFDLARFEVSTVPETISKTYNGFDGRKTAPTALNDKSSRSHAIFIIVISKLNEKNNKWVIKGKITLLDLAGSENMTSAGHAPKSRAYKLKKRKKR
jgi:hypothetical protein